MRWTLIPYTAPRPGWWQMALDQALLDEAERTGEGFLRCYRWAPACLSFGRNEPALRRYDRERIESLGLATVRRPTGGRAVWHADECTYAVAAPVDLFGSLAGSYTVLHGWIRDTLGRFGLHATLAASRRTPGLGSGACFSAAAGGEVVVGERKVAGSAQLQQGPAFLQHGSILLSGSQRLVGQVTRGEAAGSSEAPVSELLGRELRFAELAEALRAAAEGWPGEWQLASADRTEELAARHAERFRDPAWTWRR